MKILLETDFNISRTEEIKETLKAIIKDAFDRISEHRTRLEARPKRMQPLAVMSHKDPFNR
jgi:hypothetical protein